MRNSFAHGTLEFPEPQEWNGEKVFADKIICLSSKIMNLLKPILPTTYLYYMVSETLMTIIQLNCYRILIEQGIYLSLIITNFLIM